MRLPGARRPASASTRTPSGRSSRATRWTGGLPAVGRAVAARVRRSRTRTEGCTAGFRASASAAALVPAQAGSHAVTAASRGVSTASTSVVSPRRSCPAAIAQRPRGPARRTISSSRVGCTGARCSTVVAPTSARARSERTSFEIVQVVTAKTPERRGHGEQDDQTGAARPAGDVAEGEERGHPVAAGGAADRGPRGERQEPDREQAGTERQQPRGDERHGVVVRALQQVDAHGRDGHGHGVDGDGPGECGPRAGAALELVEHRSGDDAPQREGGRDECPRETRQPGEQGCAVDGGARVRQGHSSDEPPVDEHGPEQAERGPRRRARPRHPPAETTAAGPCPARAVSRARVHRPALRCRPRPRGTARTRRAGPAGR